MDAAFSRQFVCFAALSHSLLRVSLLHLDRRLVPSEYPDRTLLPLLAGRLWDEVLFGGVLFTCPQGQPCEVDTSLGVCFTALMLPEKDGFALLGPYVPEAGSRFVPEQLFARENTPPAEREHFLRYFRELPVLGHDRLHAMLDALMFELYGTALSDRFQPLELSHESPSPCPVFEEDSVSVQAEVIAARYAAENAFLDRVARGELPTEGSMPMPELHRVANPVRNSKNLLIVLNTLLRKTLERAKVPPYYIDRISAKWAVAIENADTLAQLQTMQREIAADYVRMVRQHTLAGYSSPVRAMLQYVQFHLADPALNLQALAQELGRNATYLSRQFNRETGQSLPEYIAGQRIGEARRLLRGGSAPVSQIALAVGFTDINYFSRVFRRVAGCSPTEYRALAPNDPAL
jgi:two-component system response regulator YesN